MAHRDGLGRVAAISMVLLSAVFCQNAWAQINRGSIRGTVTDPKGAVVPKVQVAVLNAETGVSQSTATDSAGLYLVSDLVPGPYTVRIVSPGFTATDIRNVAVRGGQVITVDAQLRLGSQAQAIEVTAINPLVQTDASNFSTPVDQQLVENLPMVGRDIQGLTALIPGVTQSSGPPGSLVGFSGQFGGFPDPTHIVGSQIAANGGQPGANVWYLDGNLNSAQGVDNAVVVPAPDSVAEFQAITNSFAPEYGRNAGAIFNVILKSGTNTLHGSLYEYNRNSALEARNPFVQPDVTGTYPATFVNWNQFGGTVGGPVMLPKLYNGKNRTFFFFSWDVSKLAARHPGIYTVPTIKERVGDFSELPSVHQYGIQDPLTTTYDAATGTFVRHPFLNPNGSLAAQIPSNRLDPTALWFLSQYPASNFLDPTQQNAAAGGCLNTCNNYLTTYGSLQTTQDITTKIDHSIGEKNRLFVEWLYNPTDYSLSRLPWTGATAPLTGLNGSIPFKVIDEIAGFGLTTSFTPTLLNEFRLSYSRQGDQPVPIPNALTDTSGVVQKLSGLNIPVYPPLQPTPIFSVGNLGFGPPFNNLVEITEAYTMLDNVTKVFSKHIVRAGMLFRLDQTGTEFPTETLLSFGGALVGNPVTGQGSNSIAQFLLGAGDQGSSVRTFYPTFSSTKEWAGYVQDDYYRVTSKLTLNFGLRYDFYGWFKDRFDNTSYFDFNIMNPADPARRGGIVYVNTPQHPSRVLFPANKNDFAPRFNFAYAATPKTVVRGGINIIYTNGMTQLQGQGDGPSEAPGYNVYLPWNGDITGQGLTTTGQVPAFLLSHGLPSLPVLPNPRTVNQQLLGPLGGTVLTQVKNTHDPYVTLWNLQIEKELPGDMALAVGYVGNKGTFLIGQNNRPFDYVPTNIVLRDRSALRTRVTMPSDLAAIWGSQYFLSQLFKPYPQYGGVVNFESSDLNSEYEGLQVQLRKRFSHGLDFQVSYSYQKTMADPGLGAYLSNTWTGGPAFGSGRGLIGQIPGLAGVGSAPVQNWDNRNLDRSVSPTDIPQVLNMAWTYELPIGRGKPIATDSNRLADALIGGWQISGNINVQPQGVPLPVSGPCNQVTCRVNLIGDPNAGRSQLTRYQQEQQYFNPNAFQAPFGSNPAIIQIATSGTVAQQDQYNQFYSFGTAGFLLPNARGPAFWNVDLSLFKDFRFTESKTLQFRFDAFNALNHQNFGLPNTNWCLPPNPDGSVDVVHQFGCQFGKITNVATDPRSLQFGLKFRF